MEGGHIVSPTMGAGLRQNIGSTWVPLLSSYGMLRDINKLQPQEYQQLQIRTNTKIANKVKKNAITNPSYAL